ncbi:MAG: LysM peptidoglycan-binding domain-containing protein [Anaerolineales bacterium]|jgi:LysM repeat protein
MRKEKVIFLYGLLIVLSIIASACTQSASTGNVPTQEDEDIQTILDAIENQPKVEMTPTTSDSETPEESTPEVPQADVPTPTPTPEPTKEVVQVDLKVPKKYTLQKGEFPWCIARRFNIDPTTLMNANGLSGSSYSPGLVLTIPQDAAKFQGDRSLKNHPSTYTVKSGDTFYSIACVFGDVWPEEIAAQNFMELGDALTSGTQLDIP